MEPIQVRNASIVYSLGQEGYRQVVESFSKAKWINIVSYSLFFKNNYGLEELSNVPENCRIRIVTNVPSCHDEKKMEERYRAYMQELKPEKFSNNTSVYFNFENHSKIIMTDTKAYIGSANFSNSGFHELGLLFDDNDAINKLDQLIRYFCSVSVGYYSDHLRDEMKQFASFTTVDTDLINRLINLCDKADYPRKQRIYPSTGISGLIDLGDIEPGMNAEEKEVEAFLYSLDMNQIKMIHYAMYLGRDFFQEDLENGCASVSSFFEEYNGISGWEDRHKEIEHIMNKCARLALYLKRALWMLSVSDETLYL